MNRKTGVIAFLLIAFSFCSVNNSDASLFDMASVANKAKSASSAAKEKASQAIKGAGEFAKKVEKANEIKNNILDAGELTNQIADSMGLGKFTNAVLNTAKKADEKTKEIAKKGMDKVGDVQDKVGEISGQVAGAKDVVNTVGGSIGLGNATEKFYELADKVDEQNKALKAKADEEAEKLGLKEKDKSKGNSQNGEGNDSENLNEDKTQNQQETDGESAQQSEAAVEEVAAVSEEVIKKIDSMIPENLTSSKVKMLEIADLAIEDVQYLAERLTALAKEGLKKLTLSLRGDKVSPEAALALVNALKENHQLLNSVNISGVQLGDAGVVALASVLENFPGLKYVILTGAGITGTGAISLLKVISQISQKTDDGTNVLLVDLAGNNISSEYLEVILKEWESIKGISGAFLKMDNNQIERASQNMPENIYLGKVLPVAENVNQKAPQKVVNIAATPSILQTQKVPLEAQNTAAIAAVAA